MERSFERWDALAPVYDQIFDATTPRSREAFEALARSLRFAASASSDERLELLDVGCGTGRVGALARAVLGPDRVALTLVDGSERMMDLARSALGTDAEYILSPCEPADLAERLRDRHFHVITSAFTLHHLSGEEKCAQYAYFGSLLLPNGVIAILDLVALDSLADTMADATEKEASAREDWQKAVRVGDAALANVPPNARNRDRPDSVESQLAWMADGGIEATCAWQGWRAALLIGRAHKREASVADAHGGANRACR